MMKEREYILLALTSILVSILVIVSSCTKANAVEGPLENYYQPFSPRPVVYVERVVKVVEPHKADQCFEDEVYWWVTDQGYRACQPLDDIIGLHIEWLVQQGHLRWQNSG